MMYIPVGSLRRVNIKPVLCSVARLHSERADALDGIYKASSLWDVINIRLQGELAAGLVPEAAEPSPQEEALDRPAQVRKVRNKGSLSYGISFSVFPHARAHTHMHAHLYALLRTDENPTTVLQRTFAKYRFFMSFENEISKGYVSEKYFKILSSGCVPVYYGAPDVPRLTKSKSFVNAMDYETPEELGDYLAYLDANRTAYAEYTSWRYEADPFNDWFKDYLRTKLFSAVELDAAKQALKKEGNAAHSDFLVVRRAAVCRLCNLNHLKALKRFNADNTTKGYEFPLRPVEPLTNQQVLFQKLRQASRKTRRPMRTPRATAGFAGALRGAVSVSSWKLGRCV